MRIPDDWPDSIVFLCRDGQEGREPAATAFLIRLERNSYWVYLVTARHCIEAAPDPIYVRFNTVDGHFQDYKTRKVDWWTHDGADVAALLFWALPNLPSEPAKTLKYKTIPADIFVDHDFKYRGPPQVKSNLEDGVPLGLGNEVLFIGLFTRHAGRDSNLPIVRFGHLSRMPAEPIEVEVHEAYSFTVRTGYLAECRSWGGHSGSPCFWTFPFAQEIEVQGTKGWYPGYIKGLVGLVSAHFDVPMIADRSGEFHNIHGDIETRANAGIAVITPAHQIKELLMREDLAKDRRQRQEEIDERRPKATADGTPPRRMTRKDYETALRRVSRRVKPSEPDEGSSGT